MTDPTAPDLTDTNLHQKLDRLRRPRLLIRAARCGQPDYRRGRDLPRLLHLSELPAGPEAALTALLPVEEEMENWRRAGRADYSLTAHIEILIALMAEARALPPPALPEETIAPEIAALPLHRSATPAPIQA